MSFPRREEKGKSPALASSHLTQKEASSRPDPFTTSGGLSSPNPPFKEFLQGVQSRQKQFLYSMIDDDEADEIEISEATSRIEDDSMAYQNDTLNNHIQDLKDRQMKINQRRDDKMRAFRKDWRAMFFEIYNEAYDWQKSASQHAVSEHQSHYSSSADSTQRSAEHRGAMEKILGFREKIRSGKMEKAFPPSKNSKADQTSAPPPPLIERQLRSRTKPSSSHKQFQAHMHEKDQVKKPLTPIPEAPVDSPDCYFFGVDYSGLSRSRSESSLPNTMGKSVAPSVKTAWETIWADEAASTQEPETPGQLEVELEHIREEYEARQRLREQRQQDDIEKGRA